MKDEIRIRLSVGLIFVAVLHAVMLGTICVALHEEPEGQPCRCETWDLPSASPAPTVGRQVERLPEPPNVNLGAQSELKQQTTYCPLPCPPTTQPTIVQPYRVVPSTPTVTQPIVITPTSNPSVPSVAPEPTPKRYQLALFVNGDAKSQQLLDWFDRDKNLVNLKSKCAFQVYTENNALYRTRFADIVPVSQFPVVLFQDASGGHVHAAGHTMLPSTPRELYDDLRHGYELYQQTREAQRTGALKSRGYSWDSAINPTMQLSPEDCPDGYCPIEPKEPSWRPFDRDRDGERDRLFDRDTSSRNALIWAGAGELATLALIFVAVLLLGFILIKRGL
ncbi:hypothetical protein FYK55_18350 [Roseiconus nitratireducens]|uniref:Uncharacterized protein n=1 Tax=Roseiconus nitratireducens TaxID=2605748 RepID=A0A5M6D6R4_9BACT|nr:hypothetical protein [Roseiconus nitratireducens]KAA5541519.1 hypothetical protein FYK55_18350 [Roseiconus nitratireducens]